MSEYDLQARRQLAAERAEQLARDYGGAARNPRDRDGGRRLRGRLLALIRSRGAEGAPALRSR